MSGKFKLLNPKLPSKLIYDIEPNEKLLFSQFNLTQLQNLEEKLTSLYKSLSGLIDSPQDFLNKFKYNYRYFFEL